MANYKSIAVVGKAIVKILAESSHNEFPNAEFKLIQTADLTKVKRHSKEGASICLYHIGINPVWRNVLPSLDPTGNRALPPIPLNLRFLVTPWAGDPEKQYRLIGWIIHVLGNTPVLPATFLNEIASNEIVFSSDETVGLVIDPFSPPNLDTMIQDMKQPNALLSVAYVASLAIGE
jgi:hypothetical protein